MLIIYYCSLFIIIILFLRKFAQVSAIVAIIVIIKEEK